MHKVDELDKHWRLHDTRLEFIWYFNPFNVDKKFQASIQVLITGRTTPQMDIPEGRSAVQQCSQPQTQFGHGSCTKR